MPVMSNCEKKKYLRGYERAMYDLKRAEEDLEDYRTSILYPLTLFDGIPKGGSDKSELSKYMPEIERLKKKYIKRRYLAIQKAEEIKNCINRLEDTREREVLTSRYIKGKKWEKIAEEMKEEHVRQVHRLHGRALNNLEII
jgi:DNA-directed RNA polymerase specialized sigma subunit